jgi:hypothetical protein
MRLPEKRGAATGSALAHTHDAAWRIAADTVGAWTSRQTDCVIARIAFPWTRCPAEGERLFYAKGQRRRSSVVYC